MASAGVGSFPHVFAEVFEALVGLQLMHVPYRGGGPAMNDILSALDIFFEVIFDGRAARAVQTRRRTARDRKRPLLPAAGRTDNLGAWLFRPEPNIVDRACSRRGNSRSNRRAS